MVESLFVRYSVVVAAAFPLTQDEHSFNKSVTRQENFQDEANVTSNAPKFSTSVGLY